MPEAKISSPGRTHKQASTAASTADHLAPTNPLAQPHPLAPPSYTPAPPAFRPRRFLQNGHLQTIIGNYLPRVDRLPLPVAHRIEVAPAPETKTETDPLAASHVLCLSHLQHESVRATRPTAILIHGLEGSASSQYVIGNANKLWAGGANVLRMNMRNCGGTELLSPTLYHSGLSGDVFAVLNFAIQTLGLTRISLIGYSMGGNLVLKLAGELGLAAADPSNQTIESIATTPVTADHNAEPHSNPTPDPNAVKAATPPELTRILAVSPALDLGPSADALHEPLNRIYEQKFLRALIRRYRTKARLFPKLYDPRRADGLHTLRQFDDRITAPYSGYRNADDYYHRAAAARVLSAIRTPTLILHALDDPFVRLTAQSRAAIQANPAIKLFETPHGGHCAFLADSDPARGYDGYWAEAVLTKAVLDTP